MTRRESFFVSCRDIDRVRRCDDSDRLHVDVSAVEPGHCAPAGVSSPSTSQNCAGSARAGAGREHGQYLIRPDAHGEIRGSGGGGGGAVPEDAGGQTDAAFSRAVATLSVAASRESLTPVLEVPSEAVLNSLYREVVFAL